MSLKYYKAYLNSLSKEPVDYWKELRQAATNDVWNDTATVETVLGQNSVGSLEYSKESVQLTSVLDPKTGKQLGDDYRKIIYKTLADSLIHKDTTKTNRFWGKYYKFRDYTWLTVNTNTIMGSSASAILERCNNWLKWYDKQGILHQWECVFERSLSSTSFDYGSEGVAEVGSKTLIRVQRNSETDSIPFNQRFIFDGHAFQVDQINNHISSTYMEIYMFETQIQSNDDLVNNIANNLGEVEPTTNETLITPDINKILQDESQEFAIYNYTNGVANSDTYNVEIMGGIEDINYSLNIIDGNHFVIKNILQSDTPLTITCINTQNPDDIVSMNIVLGGLW